MNLPEAYPDEHYYSVLARFSDEMELDGVAFNRFVYGVERIRPIIEFPARLDVLCSRLLPGSPYSVASLIERHSLVPYYTAFLSETAAKRAMEHVCAARAVQAFACLSINTLRNPLHLRFCSQCAECDFEMLGFTYWRRSHQLPGCVVCLRHRRVLSEGPSIRASETVGFQSAAKFLETNVPARPAAMQEDDLELAVRLGELSKALLHRPEHQGTLSAAFFQALHSAGWRRGVRLAATDLCAHILAQLGPDVLSRLRVLHRSFNSDLRRDRDRRSSDWLLSCLRVRTAVSHPLPYLLILTACGIEVASLSEFAKPTRSPTSHLHGPCGNPICPAYDPPVPRPLRGGDAKEKLVVTCPQCGFVYRQAADCREPKERRILSYGPLLDGALRAECELGTASRAQLAEKFGLSHGTLQRRALELGIWHPAWTQRARTKAESLREKCWSARHAATQASHRARWLVLKEEHPGLGRCAMGRHDESTYSFLRTHDRDWLNEVSPVAPRASRSNGDPKTSNRDAHLALVINEAADRILRSDPPERVTRKAIARACGRTHFRFKKGRNPLSASALLRRSESERDFRLRKGQTETNSPEWSTIRPGRADGI